MDDGAARCARFMLLLLMLSLVSAIILFSLPAPSKGSIKLLFSLLLLNATTSSGMAAIPPPPAGGDEAAIALIFATGCCCPWCVGAAAIIICGGGGGGGGALSLGETLAPLATLLLAEFDRLVTTMV